jgi:hypothetical protein
MNNWNEIKAFYEGKKVEIMAANKLQYGIDPYSWESLGIVMTPIESLIWGDIRSGGLVMYPQYPVCGFFVDFGNPVIKVAIECDGKPYHDFAKDAARDRVLSQHGWKVYRITGSDCVKSGRDGYDDDGYERYELSPGESLVAKIRKNHQLF